MLVEELRRAGSSGGRPVDIARELGRLSTPWTLAEASAPPRPDLPGTMTKRVASAACSCNRAEAQARARERMLEGHLSSPSQTGRGPLRAPESHPHSGDMRQLSVHSEKVRAVTHFWARSEGN